LSDVLTTDICVIGAGSGGLSVVAAAALMQVPVILIEKNRMGGECLNTGCVPSKALIAAGKHAAAMREAVDFGFTPVEIKPAFNRVNAHVQAVIAAIEPIDSAQRFEALGARVIKGEARFVDRRTVQVGEQMIRARRFVVATGSTPAIPSIPGLENVPFLTNESLFDLTRRPAKLLIIGAGPIGMEMAQAFARLGSQVVIVSQGPMLAREDPEAARLARLALERDGVVFRTDAAIEKIEGKGEKLQAVLSGPSGKEAIEATHILVAAGRRPVTGGLGLEKGGIAFTPNGITVDGRMKTSNRKVYAIGDVVGPPQFTHRSNYQAGLVIRNGLFRLPVRATDALLPRVTFTDPEIAAIGLSETEAFALGRGVRMLRWPFAENDRAQAERRTEGFIKVMVDRKGRILGVTIVGHNAGELLTPWTLAMANRLKIGALMGITFPYPTYSEISKRVATAFLLPQLQRPALQRVLRFMRLLG
jgi:pyruvate/2-oxoglutarate dehydrogenase complex dihydrolipoamide dehydrogenase (E3) component